MTSRRLRPGDTQHNDKTKELWQASEEQAAEKSASPAVGAGWMPCAERLPQPDEDVLIAIKYSDGTSITSRHSAFWTNAGGWVAWFTNDSEPVEGEVTHWMPLPEPPSST